MHVHHGTRRPAGTRVTLLTEGTYPHSHGGVSVWCDQLVQGMPDLDFDVIAVTGTGREAVSWDLPGHVLSVRSVPMWGAPPEGRPPRGRALRRLAEAYDEFLSALLDPTAEAGFPPALYAMAAAAADGALSPFLRGDQAITVLASVWNRPGLAVREARPTLRDALTATTLLEHALRPLATPPPQHGVAHAVSGGVAVLPGLAGLQRHDVPLLLTEHGVYLRERYIGYRTAPYRWPVKALVLGFFRLLAEESYRRAALITPGNRYNRLWEEEGGADPRSIRTVYNGVDPAAFPPAGPEPDVPTLSWAGRVDPIKDLETLIRAFDLVRREVPEARLRLFGGTPRGGEAYRERCEALAAELGHADAVVFEGRVDDIKDAYAAGNVVMLSSISEGFPFTLIEAMSCGRATVSTDVGGVREAVGEAGLVVPPRDPAAMAAAAVELLGDAPRRAAMGEAARLRVIEQFTLRQTIDTFRSIYLELGSPDRERADGSGPAVGTGTEAGAGTGTEAGAGTLHPSARTATAPVSPAVPVLIPGPGMAARRAAAAASAPPARTAAAYDPSVPVTAVPAAVSAAPLAVAVAAAGGLPAGPAAAAGPRPRRHVPSWALPDEDDPYDGPDAHGRHGPHGVDGAGDRAGRDTGTAVAARSAGQPDSPVLSGSSSATGTESLAG